MQKNQSAISVCHFFIVFLFTSVFSLNTAAQSSYFELTGIGIYSEFNKANMVAKLEVASSTLSTASTTERFSIRIIEAKPERRWGQFWTQNLSLNNSIEALTENFDDIQKLDGSLKGPLEPGDLITFEITGDNRAFMTLNSVELTEFDNPDFYGFLLGGIIGRVPPSNTLKEQLLGNNSDSFESDSLFFNDLSYDQTRLALIESWIAPIIEPEPIEIAVIEETPVEIIETSNDSSSSEEDIAAAERALAEQQAQERAERERQAQAERTRIAEEREQARALALAELAASQNHLRLVRTKITQNLEYPRSAVRFNREGTVRLALTLNRDGSIHDLAIIEEAEYNSLNNAALAGVKKAEPFEALPSSIRTEQTSYEFPIGFYLQ